MSPSGQFATDRSFAHFARRLRQVSDRTGRRDRAGWRSPAELGDSFRSLLANSLRTEATFLPDHAGKELDRKAVLCRRLF
jgi:hypothetical protein